MEDDDHNERIVTIGQRVLTDTKVGLQVTATSVSDTRFAGADGDQSLHTLLGKALENKHMLSRITAVTFTIYFAKLLL